MHPPHAPFLPASLPDGGGCALFFLLPFPERTRIIQAYNGSGPGAVEYANVVDALVSKFQEEEGDIVANHDFLNPTKRLAAGGAAASKLAGGMFASLSGMFAGGGGGGGGGGGSKGKPGSQGEDTYEVESGDTLSSIAASLSVTVKDMLKVTATD